MKKTIYLYKSGTLKRKDFSLACVTKDETIPIPIRQVDLIRLNRYIGDLLI